MITPNYSSLRGLGIAPITTCPHCSKLINNSCVVCGPNDPHPSCEQCEGGKLMGPPWYKSELFLAIFTTVVVTVASTIIVGRIQEAMKRKKV